MILTLQTKCPYQRFPFFYLSVVSFPGDKSSTDVTAMHVKEIHELCGDDDQSTDLIHCHTIVKLQLEGNQYRGCEQISREAVIIRFYVICYLHKLK